MTKPKFSHQDDWVLHVIVIISILIDILIDAIKCLTSLKSASSIPAPGKNALHSTGTGCTASGKGKSQPPSQSTTPTCVTEDQKKAVGTTTKVIPSKRSASSPRSKQSKPISSTQKSTKPGSSQALGFQQQSQRSRSTSPTPSPRSILSNVPTTADDTTREGHATNIDNQSA
jgi:hypothetical protein